MLHLIQEIAFRDVGKAAAALARLTGQLPPQVESRLAILLRNAADPDAALHYLARLRDEQQVAFQYLSRSPATLQLLLTVFSHSRFLSDEILKRPRWIEPLPQAGNLHRVVLAEEYAAALDGRVGDLPPGKELAGELALFRREQILRILIRDALGYGTLSDVTEELSGLADAIVHCAYRRVKETLEARYGKPRWETPDGKTEECGMSILALGKMGGRELNYSSDIDLIFVHSGSGETDGREAISNKDFYKKVGVGLTELLSSHTPHGTVYRVDLRLRPEGTLGEMSISLEAARRYYEKRARDWELQMLIKARVCAGERAPGRELLEFVEPLTYSSSTDFSKVEAVSEARHRISEKLAKRRGGKGEFDVKLAPGGIRDIEFLVQCLQRLHGGKEPWVRHGGTLLALFRLRDKALLSDNEYPKLAAAYQFLRNLEHRLQFHDDRQTHALPAAADELELLARRMPPAQLGAAPSAASLNEQLNKHLEAVKAIYDRVVHTRLPLHYTLDVKTLPETPAAVEPVTVNLALELTQKSPALAASIDRSKLRYGARQFEHFLERVLPSTEWMTWLEDDPQLAAYLTDIFEYSPYFAEQFNRKPELIEELREMRSNPGVASPYESKAGEMADPAALRRFFNREMLRIQCESICLRQDIFKTLARTSDLVDFAISRVYAMAVEYTAKAHPPHTPGYAPRDQLMVVALGRLGMREFDLGSDADLIFVLADDDVGEREFWTHVASRVIEVLTAYTGDGVMFAIDTRLRPNGREGPLVQTESGYKDYFSRTAQAWEGITYMKSRAVAGNLDRGTRFLEELQAVDWRRYGQGGRSRDKLRHMRLRLENEHGRSNPLKAGAGGYYDIDFSLMFLRLKSAGMFFRVLNTPERIEIIEKMGHLDRPEAQFLLEAATFYRAIDHALRLSSGHAEGQLPHAQLQLEMISELAGRWTPPKLHDQPLPDELAQIQRKTREYFDRLF